MKQICLKLVLFVLSVFTFLSVSAYDFEADGLYFTITSPKDLTVSVDGAVNKDTDKVVIPQTVVYKNKTLTITSVGSEAFKNYKNLQSISFPNTMLSIGWSAFEEDELLVDVVLPDSLLRIGSNAFQGCTSLKTVRIPEKVVDLNDNVFWGCSGLISVTLNDSVRTIGDGSFYGTSIKELKLPLSLSDIGAHAFEDSKIREINFPKSLRSIGNGAFMNSELLHIELPMSLTSIGEQAFKNTKVRQIDVGVENIPESCFENCDSLKYIRWTGEIKSIGRDAFGGCSSLESFTIPSSVTEISTSILWGCPNISKLTIGKGLDALPFYWRKNAGNFGVIHESLTGFYNSFSKTVIKCLQGLKTVIIEDASSPFAIRGSCVSSDGEAIPSFADLDLNYYYVGRPLKEIDYWEDRGYYYHVNDYYHVNGLESRGHIKKLEIAGTCTKNPYFYQDVDTLILGAKIKSFDVDRLHLDSLKAIEFKSTTPPEVLNGNNIPNKVYVDVTLYVPKGYKDAYSNDPVWGTFWTIKEYEVTETNITNITNVTDNLKDIAITTQNGSIIVSNAPHNTLVQVYNLQGALVAKSRNGVISGLSKGAYLVNVGGKTFKLVL